MKRDQDPVERCCRIDSASERIESCGRISIEQGIAQTGLAHDTSSELRMLVGVVAKTRFVVPGLEVLAQFTQVAAQTGIEKIVVSSFFKGTRAGTQLAIEH